jgi:hypothetical protein
MGNLGLMKQAINSGRTDLCPQPRSYDHGHDTASDTGLPVEALQPGGGHAFV